MPLRADDLLLTVTLNGTDVSSIVETVNLRFGLQSRFSQATVTFADTPSRWSAWDPLVISCGLYSRAGDMSGNVQRFNGYALDPSVTHWPYQPKLIGEGPLGIAARTIVIADAYGSAILAPTTTPAKWWDIATSTGYVDGIDLTQGVAAGKLDSDMVTFILDQCGLASRIASASDIGGMAPLLGSYAFDQFVWRVNQSGLQAIEQLDGMFSFSTFETLNGNIVRQRATAFAPFAPVFTFLEGTHILQGATVTREVQNIKNMVICTGYDDGSGPFTWMAKGGVAVLPPGSTWQVKTVQSNLYESDTIAEGVGLSCEAAAQEFLSLLQYPMLRATIPTHWDYPFAPGQIVYLNAPHLLGVNQAMWVQEVQIDVQPNTFTQTLTLYAADYGSTGSAPNTSPPGLPVLGNATSGSGSGAVIPAMVLPANLLVGP